MEEGQRLLAQDRLGVTFQSPKLLEQAITHTSVNTHEFERLAFVGNDLLNQVVVDRVFRASYDTQSKLHNMDVAVLTTVKGHIISVHNIGNVGKEMGIQDVLVLGKSLEALRHELSPRVLSDGVRSLLGAIFFDGGYNKMKEFVDCRFFPNFEDSLEELADGPHSHEFALQELPDLAREKYRTGILEYRDTTPLWLKGTGTVSMNAVFAKRVLGKGKGRDAHTARGHAALNALLNRQRWPE